MCLANANLPLFLSACGEGECEAVRFGKARVVERVYEPCRGACALAGMAVLRLYHHPTVATTTTIATTTTSTIAVRREHGRGGEKPGVWMRLGMRQRGREETRRGKFDLRTRRINGCFWRVAEKREESKRGEKNAER